MSSISINNCVFMGRLTDEPEMRYTRSNKPVTTFPYCGKPPFAT